MTLALYLLLFLTIIINPTSTDQAVLRATPIASLGACFWEVIGPFPTGMREQDFGADPLEAFGMHAFKKGPVLMIRETSY